MAYDRYDREERSRWADERSDRRWRGDDPRSRADRDRDDRGFFERMGDEVRSWFGDEEHERRHEREHGHERNRPHPGRDWDRGYGRDYERDRSTTGERQRERSDRDLGEARGPFDRGGSSERDYNRGWREELWGGRRDERRHPERSRDRERSHRPMTGDYGRGTDHESEQFFAASGYGRGERGVGQYPRTRERTGDYDRSETPWGRDEYRRTSYAGSRRPGRDFDPNYDDWRERHMSDLDRDYEDYRRERQSRFESDFGSWREKRQQKRALLGQIREHMEVVGKDDEHLGTVDRVAGDRIILTKSDPESGGAHHSISCSLVDRIEGDRVVLDRPADEARHMWRDENRSRALFEREDQGEMGPGILDRSFSGTYR